MCASNLSCFSVKVIHGAVKKCFILIFVDFVFNYIKHLNAVSLSSYPVNIKMQKKDNKQQQQQQQKRCNEDH